MFSVIINSILIGFLNCLRGRGLSKNSSLIYKIFFNKTVFVLAQTALIFITTNNIYLTLIFLLTILTPLWIGTGGMMLTFTGNIFVAKNEIEFLIFDKIYNHFFQIETELQAKIKGLIFCTVIGAIQFSNFLTYAIFTNDYSVLIPASILLLQGVFIFALNFLNTNDKWLISEFILGFLYSFVSLI